MEQLDIPKKLINLTKMTLNQTRIKVKTGNRMGEAFQYNKGVKQGGGLSTTLFNIALHGAISKIDKRGQIFTKSSQICEVTIIARTEKDLKNVYMKLEEEVNKYGFITNMNKMKYMVISHDKIRNQKLFQIEEKKFEEVKTFGYLGMIINNQNNITETIKEKIQARNTAYYFNLHLLKNKTISRKAKINIYETLIRPVVT
jgi:hypothetical protein